jgi:hypothetical protein
MGVNRSAVGVLGLAMLAGAFGLGVVVAQQQTPATKVIPLMKQATAEFPGHEVTMITGRDFAPSPTCVAGPFRCGRTPMRP